MVTYISEDGNWKVRCASTIDRGQYVTVWSRSKGGWIFRADIRPPVLMPAIEKTRYVARELTRYVGEAELIELG